MKIQWLVKDLITSGKEFHKQEAYGKRVISCSDFVPGF